MANFLLMQNSGDKTKTQKIVDKLVCLDLAFTRLMEIRSNNVLESDIMNVTFHSHIFIRDVVAHLPYATQKRLLVKPIAKFVDLDDLSGPARISDILSIVSAHIQNYRILLRLVSQ